MHVEKDIKTIEELDLATEITNRDERLFHFISKKDTENAEKELINLYVCFLNVPEEDQLGTFKFYTISIVTELTRSLMKKHNFSANHLSNSTAILTTIEEWDKVCDYFNWISWFINIVTSKFDVELTLQNTNTYVQEIIQLVENNLQNTLTIKWIAEQLNLSSSYISRIFKESMDISIIKFINRKKAVAAAYDMKHSTLSIGTICEKYHFKNHSYFTRVFKQTYGVTPLQYRKGDTALVATSDLAIK